MKHITILTACLLFALPLCAREYTRDQRNTPKSEAAKLEYLISKALKQEQYLIPTDLSKLSKNQKQYLNTYWQFRELMKTNKLDFSEFFVPLYQPPLIFLQQLTPILQKDAETMQARYDKFLRSGNEKLAAVALKRYETDSAILKIIKEYENNYKKKLNGNLNSLLQKYREQEIAMKVLEVKLPQREWLTPNEAELLSRRLARMAISRRNKNNR